MNPFNPESYGPVFAPLLSYDRRRSLGVGTPDKIATAALDRLTTQAAFAHATIADRDMAACCLSGLWLLHDFLDESHKLSQEIDTPDGSFWHAIMHRREGDFENSKYWFRRVGRHPVFGRLGQRVQIVAADVADASASLGETRLHGSGEWDPFAFVDLCEAVVRGRSRDSDLCLDIQQAEWELLFDHCYRGAIGDL
jgi:hypothetical protein